MGSANRHSLYPLVIALCLAASAASAAPPAQARKPASPGTRSGHLDFEGEVVEGVNNANDALNSLARRDHKKDAHLYRKRENFHDETDQTVMDLGVKP